MSLRALSISHQSSPVSTDPPQLSRWQIDALADDIALCAARIDAAEAQLLRHIRRFDEARGWAHQGAESAAHWLSWRIGWGLGTAREKVRVARALGELSKIEAAFFRGELSYCKVRALTRCASSETEGRLLELARGATGSQLEKICAGFRRAVDGDGGLLFPKPAIERGARRRPLADGMVRIELTLHADEAERVWMALRETKLRLDAADHAPDAAHASGGAEQDASAKTRGEEIARDGGVDISAETPRATLADAAVAMAEEQLRRKAPRAQKPCPAPERRQLLVHLREERIALEAPHAAPHIAGDPVHTPWVAELQDGTLLRGETLKRIACDSALVAAKTDDRASVLDIGRRRRTVSPALLRALLIRDRCCRFPGCTHSVFVEAHHVEHWMDGGGTSLENMLLVCTRHHTLLHEGGFGVEWSADGEPLFRDAVGRRIDHCPPRPGVGAEPLTELARAQQSRGIDIDCDTARCDWDGSALDLFGAVDSLARLVPDPPSQQVEAVPN